MIINFHTFKQLTRLFVLMLIIEVKVIDMSLAQSSSASSTTTIVFSGEIWMENGSCCGPFNILYLREQPVHVTVHSTIDDKGCIHYTFHHNLSNNIEAFDYIGNNYRGTQRSTKITETIVCDLEQCDISFIMEGSFVLEPTKNNYCQASMVVHYSYLVSWNRCTDVWQPFVNLDNNTASIECIFPKISHSQNKLPATLELQQNFPNPFNPTTKISYAIPEESLVRLNVIDFYGREVSELVNESKETGTYTVEFDGRNLASGVYLYRLDVNNKILMKMMNLVK